MEEISIIEDIKRVYYWQKQQCLEMTVDGNERRKCKTRTAADFLEDNINDYRRIA